MKIAILGSAPSSVRLAPYGDPSFQIWGCSPGVYSVASRVDVWFELHRWEPGVIGRADTQKPWFTPEYVAWMAMQPCVWMKDVVPEIPGSRALPHEDLVSKYGAYFFTSSIAFMLACAIEDILEKRRDNEANGIAREEEQIALFGVDMAANEEYGYQRAGCQYFVQLAGLLGIGIYVPPESDLMRPMPLYGIAESSHWMIKNTARRDELTTRLIRANQTRDQAVHEIAVLQGALDDLKYHMDTWCEDRPTHGTQASILAQSPAIRDLVLTKFPRVDVNCEPLAESATVMDPKVGAITWLKDGDTWEKDGQEPA